MTTYERTMSDQLKICVVKQNSCYDLYTQTGPNARSILESSNMRTGPIGLWGAFDCSFKVVADNSEKECQLGERHWKKFVKGWNYKKIQSPEHSSDIDWSLYHIVISIDVAIPSKIVMKYPGVMWCYYFLEGGPVAIDTLFRGSPFYCYNVFLNHRLSKNKLTKESKEISLIQNKRRAVLDFPFYILSSETIQQIYHECNINKRCGIVLSHHSYPVVSEHEKMMLSEFGEVFDKYSTISDIHKLELKSKYFIVHPECKPMAGLALIEAISAGCLVIAPRKLIWGFPELINESFDYCNFSEMIDILRFLENDIKLYDAERRNQSSKVDDWCFINPTNNLEYLYRSFKFSNCSLQKQYMSEKFSYIKAAIEKLIIRILRLLKLTSFKLLYNNE